jgi:hypothetical protein
MKAKGIKQVAYVDVRSGGSHASVHGTGTMAPVSWHDCAGGGQVVVERGIAYVGNMRNPDGTTIIDVKDPKHPKTLAELTLPPGTHSHKVRVQGRHHGDESRDPRRARLKGEVPPADWHGGSASTTSSNPSKPKHITNWDTDDKPGPSYARGVHRFDFDGRDAYISRRRTATLRTS